MKFAITNRWTGSVQFEAEIDCREDAPRSFKLGLAVKWAVKTGTDITATVLRGADLTGTDITATVLRGADLRGADLTRADITATVLRDADLTGAVLTRADLRGTVLTGAVLRGADLRGADLRGADLRGTVNMPRFIDGGMRSDGYGFQWIEGRIHAGCRNFSPEEAREHWGSAGYRDPALGRESLMIVGHMLALAEMRWPAGAEAAE